MSSVIYLGLILTDTAQAELVRRFPLRFPVMKAHHMTVQFKPGSVHGLIHPRKVGDVVQLKVLGEVWDDKCQAVLVSGFESANYFPHVTMSHTSDTKPVYSNRMLGESTNWRPCTEALILECRIGIFVRDKGVQYDLGGVFERIEKVERVDGKYVQRVVDLKQGRDALFSELGREPTDAELGSHLGWATHRVLEVRAQMAKDLADPRR